MKNKSIMREYLDGTKSWVLGEQYHREDGPAIEWLNGAGEWYFKGKLHREGGPATYGTGVEKGWWLNGVKYSFEEYISELERRGLQDKVVDSLFHMV